MRTVSFVTLASRFVTKLLLDIDQTLRKHLSNYDLPSGFYHGRYISYVFHFASLGAIIILNPEKRGNTHCYYKVFLLQSHRSEAGIMAEHANSLPVAPASHVGF